MKIFTIGHSTHPLNEFLACLRPYEITRLIDVRTVPRSRHNPQFNKPELSRFLRNHRVAYRHMKTLGGLRHACNESPNTGWRNKSFRGYADYMQTLEFKAAVAKLLELAREKPTVIMCAEAVPWRCHRSLIADALVIRGISVVHIMGPNQSHLHKLTPMARKRGTFVTYPIEK